MADVELTVVDILNRGLNHHTVLAQNAVACGVIFGAYTILQADSKGKVADVCLQTCLLYTSDAADD